MGGLGLGALGAVAAVARAGGLMLLLGAAAPTGPGVGAVRAARHQPADQRDQPRFIRTQGTVTRALGVAEQQLLELIVELLCLGRGEPELRLAQSGGVSPFLRLPSTSRPGRSEPLHLTLEEHVGQRVGRESGRRVVVVALAPLEAFAHRAPEPVTPRAPGCLPDEAVLGELAQVPRTVGRRLVHQGCRLAGRHRALGDERAEERNSDRMRQCLEGGGFADPAAAERHASKVSFRKRTFNRLPVLILRRFRVRFRRSARATFAVSENPWSGRTPGALLLSMTPAASDPPSSDPTGPSGPSEGTAPSSRSLLILGGTSWLGGAVARSAVERGHEVTCLARGMSGKPPDGVRFVEADRWDAGAYAGVSDQHWDSVLD